MLWNTFYISRNIFSLFLALVLWQCSDDNDDDDDDHDDDGDDDDHDDEMKAPG